MHQASSLGHNQPIAYLFLTEGNRENRNPKKFQLERRGFADAAITGVFDAVFGFGLELLCAAGAFDLAVAPDADVMWCTVEVPDLTVRFTGAGSIRGAVGTIKRSPSLASRDSRLLAATSAFTAIPYRFPTSATVSPMPADACATSRGDRREPSRGRPSPACPFPSVRAAHNRGGTMPFSTAGLSSESSGSEGVGKVGDQRHAGLGCGPARYRIPAAQPIECPRVRTPQHSFP